MPLSTLALIAITVLVSSFLSGVFGMAGGMILLGVLLVYYDGTAGFNPRHVHQNYQYVERHPVSWQASETAAGTTLRTTSSSCSVPAPPKARHETQRRVRHSQRRWDGELEGAAARARLERGGSDL
jgi:hypothetical protein